MTGHRVVTFERNGGYAARCEEPGCDDMTFGGFATRSAARAALEHRDHDANPEPRSTAPQLAS